MSSDTDIEEKIMEAAQEVVASEGPFIPTISRTDIRDTNDFGDFEYYGWERYYNQNMSVSTVRDFFNAVSSLERFIHESDRIDCSADNITDREAEMFTRWLTDEVEASTASAYINELDNMCQLYRSAGYYPGNPFRGLADTIDTDSRGKLSQSYQSNERITVDDSRLREAIMSTHGSSKIVLLAVLLKTGVRISEAVNLDWQDIHIDHSLSGDLIPEPRFELSDHPDTIYIDADKTEETDSSRRINGNKRKVHSYIPIDSELKRLLIWHALARVRRFDNESPVFMVNDGASGGASGRLGIATAWDRVTNWAQEYGWWESGRGEKRNVTPHWFRSKFSSYMTRRLEAAAKSSESDFDTDPEAIVKGLRGDVGEDVIETYRLRKQNYYDYIRSRQFKIGLEGI